MHAIRQAHKKKEKDSLLTCIYRASVPVTHVAMMHSLELVLVVVILLYYKISLVGIILYAPFLILLVMIFMCIAGVLLYFRFYWSNITQLWMLLLRMLFFVTPIFYSTKFLLINHINPIFYMVDIGRSLLISKDITIAIFVTITALVLGVIMKLVKRVQ
jgi:ABC-type polysaccharide/polyol phosphate export permease